MDHSLDNSVVPMAERLTRLRHVERQWNAQVEITNNRWWRTWERSIASLLIAATLAFVLVPLDAAAWGIEAFPLSDSLDSVPSGWFWIWAAVLLCGNALILDTLLTWRTPGTLRVRAPVRHLRLLACSVPLLGLYAISFWKWVLVRRPTWAVTAKDLRLLAAPTGSFRRVASQVLARGSVAAILAILWLHGVNLVFLLVWTSKLSALRSPRYEAQVLHVFLHIVVFCCLLDFLRDLLRKKTVGRWRRTFLWALPPLSLLFALGGVIGLLSYETEGEKTLCGKAYFDVHGARRLTAWAHLQDTLDRSPGIFRNRLRIEGIGRSEIAGRWGRQLTELYRLKTFLLTVDALFVGLLAGHLANRPGWQAPADNAVALLTWAALLAAGASALLAAARTLVRSLGSPQRRSVLDAHGYGSLLALGLFAAALSLNAGVWMQRGKTQQAALLVALFVASGLMLTGMAVLLRPLLRRFDLHREKRHEDTVWLVFFFALALASGLMGIDETAARIGRTVLVSIAFLAPFWHVALALVFQETLLQQRPRREWLLRGSLFLPLGGLAVPLWVLAFHRRPSPGPGGGES